MIASVVARTLRRFDTQKARMAKIESRVRDEQLRSWLAPKREMMHIIGRPPLATNVV
jgi:hypothetical protein